MKPSVPLLLRRCGAVLTRGLLVLVIFCGVVAAQSRGSERWATLEAIHQLENPCNSNAPGPYGELGAYQFREDTWKMHSSAPFRRALDRRSSDIVAVKHYEWIKSEIERRGVIATPYRIALAWNGGIKAVFDQYPPASAIDYADRAANLTAEFDKGGTLADAR